ncbi:hypothetical protein P8452_37931 [Trifolium repens]|nr:hypothetical protein P8452_37931 [Trifolium repens]
MYTIVPKSSYSFSSTTAIRIIGGVVLRDCTYPSLETLLHLSQASPLTIANFIAGLLVPWTLCTIVRQ